jgi:uncharacterized protein DUF4234
VAQHEPVPGGEPAGQSLHGEVAPDHAPLRSEQLEPDDPALVRDRNPIVVAILSFVTLGIYVIFWWYYIKPGDGRLRPRP